MFCCRATIYIQLGHPRWPTTMINNVTYKCKYLEKVIFFNKQTSFNEFSYGLIKHSRAALSRIPPLAEINMSYPVVLSWMGTVESGAME